MKKTLWLLLTFLILLSAPIWADETLMSVQVREVILRSTPSFLGKITGKLQYADRVVVLEEKAGWGNVSQADKGISGWLHMSALTKADLKLSAGKTVGSTASSEEIARAGKAFNKEIEAKYVEDNNLDTSWIDYMEEELGYEPAELVLFLREGGVE